MKVRRMADLALAGKRVLIREDLNVPVADGVVTSDARIRAALPTLKQALAAGAKVFVMSHLGRPEEGIYGDAAVHGETGLLGQCQAWPHAHAHHHKIGIDRPAAFKRRSPAFDRRHGVLKMENDAVRLVQ